MTTIISNNFNDIDNLIRMCYDFFYNNNKVLEYDIKPTSITELENIDSIKRILNKSNTYTFINTVLNDKLIFIKSVVTIFGKKYIFKKINDPISVNITLYIYNDIDDQNNLSSSENLNKVFLKLFSDFLTYQQTKHILIQILNVDVELMEIEDFIKSLNIEEFKSIYNDSGAINKIMSISITEHFFKMVNLIDYLTNKKLNASEYKVLIFQVIHTLAVIQNKYPNFRHNCLIVKNMEGYEKNGTNNTTNYTFNGHQFNVPNIGFVYKMNNFESSLIVNTIKNDDIDENLCEIDRSYDIITFLKSLMNDVELPEETLIFCKNIIKDNTITPAILLNDEYFEEFKNIDNKLKRSINKNKNNYINKFSSQNLIEVMKKPSFLFRGTRKIKDKNGKDAIDDDNINFNLKRESGKYTNDEDSFINEFERSIKTSNTANKSDLKQEVYQNTKNGNRFSSFFNDLSLNHVDLAKMNNPMNNSSVMDPLQMIPKSNSYTNVSSSMMQPQYQSIEPSTKYSQIIQQPSMMNPSMMDQSMMNPSMMNQSMMNPSMMNPSMMNPSMMNPSMMDPSMMNSSMMNPSMMDQSMMNQPMSSQMMNSSMMDPQMMYPQMMQQPLMMNPQMMQQPLMMNPMGVNPSVGMIAGEYPVHKVVENKEMTGGNESGDELETTENFFFRRQQEKKK